jgi:hypothetical protein
MSAGKGDTPRKVDGEKFRQHYDAIYSKPSNGYIGAPDREPMTVDEACRLHEDPRWYPTIDYAVVARLTGQKNRMTNRYETAT